MECRLIQAGKLSTVVIAARTCYNSHDKGGFYLLPNNSISKKDIGLLKRLMFDYVHESVFEHINYTFELKGVPRYVLTELTRHRIASYSVKSTRFTLSKELKNEKEFTTFDIERASKFLYFSTENKDLINFQILQLEILRKSLQFGTSDIAKATIPESLKTDIIMTINLRSLRNFLKLRLGKTAHFAIRELAKLIYDNIPKTHKFLFTDIIQEDLK